MDLMRLMRLLARGTTGLKLTEAGEAFYQRARQLLGEIDELRAGMVGAGRHVAGRLRVNSPAAFGEQYLTPILVGLAQRNPALMVDLVLSDHCIDLVEGGIDVAIRFGPGSVAQGAALSRGAGERIPRYARACRNVSG